MTNGNSSITRQDGTKQKLYSWLKLTTAKIKTLRAIKLP